jgi:hypothetical protein
MKPYNHPYVDRTGVLHQGRRRGITPTARITLFASTKLLKIEKSVLKDNTLIRKQISVMINARLDVYNLVTSQNVDALVKIS